MPETPLTPCYMIYPYYENLKMLEYQVQNWNDYSDPLRKAVHIIVVDDGSPRNPALSVFKECQLSKTLLRIKPNIPWNQHGARNLGAHFVKDDNAWLFFSDMDYLAHNELMTKLLSQPLDPERFYTFRSVRLPEMVTEKRPFNMFMAMRRKYWAAGGYDEDYCGTYGTDGHFFDALTKVVRRVDMADLFLQRVRETHVEDAITLEWDRLTYQRMFFKRNDAKKAAGNPPPVKPLRFDWIRQL